MDELVRSTSDVTDPGARARGAGGAVLPSLRASSLDFQGERFVVLSAPITEPASLAPLTDSELAVALLVLRGLRNAEIAYVRGTSARTVANQLASLYRKLGVGSRTELAARFASPTSEGRHDDATTRVR